MACSHAMSETRAVTGSDGDMLVVIAWLLALYW
jgi:hypothetical protein